MKIYGKAGTVQDLSERPVWFDCGGQRIDCGVGAAGMRKAAYLSELNSGRSSMIRCGGQAISVEQAWRFGTDSYRRG